MIQMHSAVYQKSVKVIKIRSLDSKDTIKVESEANSTNLVDITIQTINQRMNMVILSKASIPLATLVW